jgi:hypothetical protein
MSLRLVGFPDHFGAHDQHVYVNPECVTAVYGEGGYTVIRLAGGGHAAVDASVDNVAELLTRAD